jgi:hypothetical protein
LAREHVGMTTRPVAHDVGAALPRNTKTLNAAGPCTGAEAAPGTSFWSDASLAAHVAGRRQREFDRVLRRPPAKLRRRSGARED